MRCNMSKAQLFSCLIDIRRLQDLKRSRLHIEVVKQPPYAFIVKMSVPLENKFGSEIFHRDMDDNTLQAKYERILKIYKQYE